MRLRPVSGVADQSPRPDEDFVEVMLLLPVWQVAALETAARSRGLTTGGMLRRLIRDYLMRLDDTMPASLPRSLDADGKPREGRNLLTNADKYTEPGSRIR
jgi:hypothetical protein